MIEFEGVFIAKENELFVLGRENGSTLEVETDELGRDEAIGRRRLAESIDEQLILLVDGPEERAVPPPVSMEIGSTVPLLKTKSFVQTLEAGGVDVHAPDLVQLDDQQSKANVLGLGI